MSTHTAENLSPIGRTLRLAEKVTPEAFSKPFEARITKINEGTNNPTSLTERAQDLRKRYHALNKLAEQLDSPVEYLARERIHEKASDTVSEFGKAESLAKSMTISIAEAMASIKRGAVLAPKYPQIVISEIPWVNEKEPLVIPIRMDATTCTLTFDRWSVTCRWDKPNWGGQKGYPIHFDNLTRLLEEIFSRCAGGAHRDSYREHKITYKYPGLLPRSVKEKIKSANADFQEEGCIFLLADAAILEKEVVVSNPDPLVVGYHPECPEHFWLIDAFDMTPIEQLINDEALARFAELHKE